MNKQQITAALGQPQNLNEQTLDPIREVLDEYPFFQAGRMLWIKNLHLLGHIRYNNELKLAAAHIADRARLFELLHVPETTTVTEDGIIDKDPSVNKEPSLGERHSPTIDESHVQVDPTAADDYFGAEDDYETEVGKQLDFSRSFEEEREDEEEEIKYTFPDETENIVLPSADLLGYEMVESSFYKLSGHEAADWDEARSFSGWLSVLKNQPAPVPASEWVIEEGEEKAVKKMSLIDNFLESGMKKRLTPPEKAQDRTDEIVDISAKSLQENEDLMTETLANIYIKQKHFFKAIDIFERLRLKYPEKNLYFARRIKELEEQINNQ